MIYIKLDISKSDILSCVVVLADGRETWSLTTFLEQHGYATCQ